MKICFCIETRFKCSVQKLALKYTTELKQIETKNYVYLANRKETSTNHANEIFFTKVKDQHQPIRIN